ncbi:Protein of unknown function [Cryptosporangium aurantiacum]|uniref:DUF4245 domain-containing protein n=1 Tax=Cryptosporangium aurantiacum TaxID=134849 RepID=A0A1M7QRY3_9ACTN|nr:Protein of unknown function [Cryptosporangium aurantiacum]
MGNDRGMADIVDSAPERKPVTVGISTDAGTSTPPPKATRADATVRNLAIALGILVIPLVAIVALFQPKASDSPTVDPSNVYNTARAEKAFRVREPQGLDWRATVAAYNPAAGGRFTIRVSYATPDDRYLQLVQSNAAADSLITSIIDSGAPAGVEQIEGESWTRYTAREGQEDAFVLIEPDVTVVVVGDASLDTARTMIRSLQ